jgi:hypothetical protein
MPAIRAPAAPGGAVQALQGPVDYRDQRHRTALNTDIRDWITTWNENPQALRLVKTADQTLDNLTQYLYRINHSRH